VPLAKFPWRAFHHFWMSAGPGQVQIGVHGHVLVFRILGRAGLEPVGLLAVEVLVGDVRPGDQAERLAGDPQAVKVGLDAAVQAGRSASR
jgi:hypothetical protein